MSKYLGIFGAFYFGLIVVTQIFFYLLDLSFGGKANIPILIVSAIAAGYFFLKQENRLPDPKEKKKLIWGSLLASVVISLLVTIGGIVHAGGVVSDIGSIFQGIPPLFLAIGVFGALLIHYVCLLFVYSFLMRYMMKSLQKK